VANYGATEPIVILGFGEMGQVSCIIFSFVVRSGQQIIICLVIFFIQVLAKFLAAPLSFGLEQDTEGWPYVAFDLNPAVVKVGVKRIFWYNS
jgi:hypothetical protein